MSCYPFSVAYQKHMLEGLLADMDLDASFGAASADDADAYAEMLDADARAGTTRHEMITRSRYTVVPGSVRVVVNGEG